MLSLIPSTITIDLFIHITFVAALALLLPFVGIPSLFLAGLHTYIHPDDVDDAGIRRRRRPGDSDKPNPRNRSLRDNKLDLDESSKAQIFRLKLTDDRLKSRTHFDLFSGAFNLTLLSSLSLSLHILLNVDAANSGVVKSGTPIPILMGFLGIGRLILAVVKVGSAGSEETWKRLGFVFFSGFSTGAFVVFGVIPRWVLDFTLQEKLDWLGKLILSTLMGCIAGYLYVPAFRSGRCLWLGTDQLRCNLPFVVVSRGYLSRALLYASYVMPVFASLLWITPFTEAFARRRRSFDGFRAACMAITGGSQILAVRTNVQTFLNEGVLSWYRGLHGSRVPDLEQSRARVFLRDRYLCSAGVQFFVPPASVLLLVGLSRLVGGGLVEEAVLFLAWWIVVVWGVMCSVVLVSFRRGSLYIS
ncbi:hypothetical protein M569_14065 [Genlisea aurea]|uniref:Uncharacterized protein n=1 Tax=Genlisea aurea TaxID=192259 RepID=S8C211_9LAMI|nr:hypothetical protein M569_14065 [Genlisea aurea]